MKKLLVIQVAALGYDLVKDVDLLNGFKPVETVFPAVTCCSQAAFRTASDPLENGMIANGVYSRDLAKTDFWNQSARLIKGERIWEGFRSKGGSVGMMFWQQSLGEDVDLVMSPAPIHKHHGGMIQDCYSIPADLYSKVCASAGKKFNLMHYWGPLASGKSTDWITKATLAVLNDNPPDLLFTYLPHLDYALQKFGPEGKTIPKEVDFTVDALKQLTSAAQNKGYEVLIWGDYAIEPASQVVYINNILMKAGLFKVRKVKNMLYPDLFSSKAFAMVDHQVAHVFINNVDKEQVKAVLEQLQGVDTILEKTESMHANCGEFILTAKENCWFAYQWWDQKSEAPDYATHVDIHSKPGFDPCELFWGWPPPSIGQTPEKVGGTHGRTAKKVAVAASFDFGGLKNICEISKYIKNNLE